MSPLSGIKDTPAIKFLLLQTHSLIRCHCPFGTVTVLDTLLHIGLVGSIIPGIIQLLYNNLTTSSCFIPNNSCLVLTLSSDSIANIIQLSV